MNVLLSTTAVLLTSLSVSVFAQTETPAQPELPQKDQAEYDKLFKDLLNNKETKVVASVNASEVYDSNDLMNVSLMSLRCVDSAEESAPFYPFEHKSFDQETVVAENTFKSVVYSCKPGQQGQEGFGWNCVDNANPTNVLMVLVSNMLLLASEDKTSDSGYKAEIAVARIIQFELDKVTKEPKKDSLKASFCYTPEVY